MRSRPGLFPLAYQLVGEAGAQEVGGPGLHPPQPNRAQLLVGRSLRCLDHLLGGALPAALVEDDLVRLELPTRSTGVVFRRPEALEPNPRDPPVLLGLAPSGVELQSSVVAGDGILVLAQQDQSVAVVEGRLGSGDASEGRRRRLELAGAEEGNSPPHRIAVALGGRGVFFPGEEPLALYAVSDRTDNHVYLMNDVIHYEQGVPSFACVLAHELFHTMSYQHGLHDPRAGGAELSVAREERLTREFTRSLGLRHE